MPPQANDDPGVLADTTTFGFCFDGDFNRDGRRDRAAVGVYQTHAGEQGRFLVVLTETSPDRWHKTFLRTVPGSPGFGLLSLERSGGLGWWSCMECDNWAELVWVDTAYILKPHPGGDEGPDDETGQATGTQTGCDRGLPVSVSKDSVGPLPIAAPIRVLRLMCPGAKDTVQYGEESAHPAIVFPFHGLLVLALQDRDELHAEEPPDAWVLSGTTGSLPRGVPMGASWTDLVQAYGDSTSSIAGSESVMAMFCSLPGFLFEFDGRDAATDTSSGRPKVSPGAVPRQVLIRMILPAGWKC
jgi:hypothetical protein